VGLEFFFGQSTGIDKNNRHQLKFLF